MGWTLDERRELIVDAALRLAADQGLEHVNLRAAANAAGLSWDVVQQAFEDHTDLLAELSRVIMLRNVAPDSLDLDIDPADGVEAVLEQVALRLWRALSANRDLQLVSYELTVHALRRTSLRALVAEQYRNQSELAETILAGLTQRFQLRWTKPIPDLARFAATFLDGVSIAWLVDRDHEAAEAQAVILAHALAGFVARRPA